MSMSPGYQYVIQYTLTYTRTRARMCVCNYALSFVLARVEIELLTAFTTVSCLYSDSHFGAVPPINLSQIHFTLRVTFTSVVFTLSQLHPLPSLYRKCHTPATVLTHEISFTNNVVHYISISVHILFSLFNIRPVVVIPRSHCPCLLLLMFI